LTDPYRFQTTSILIRLITGALHGYVYCLGAAQKVLMPTEAELLAGRLARLKPLFESLEAQCAQSEEAQTKFDRLKREMDDIRARIKVIDLP
jgi:hypothetical protein